MKKQHTFRSHEILAIFKAARLYAAEEDAKLASLVSMPE